MPRWPSPAERLLAKIDKQPDTGCWIWTGTKNPKNGYGYIRFNGRQMLAHRASHELFIGPIPPQLVVDHLCRVRACVNPDHLEAVSPRENVVRAPSHTINTGSLASTRSPTWTKYVPEWAKEGDRAKAEQQ